MLIDLECECVRMCLEYVFGIRMHLECALVPMHLEYMEYTYFWNTNAICFAHQAMLALRGSFFNITRFVAGLDA